ncbi:MAG: DUF5615 family PIN-like protein [Bacteroidetes bacterium]|nr:DUF5615 family PIN-like protein [Bacteroidota bacterium]
MKFLVDECCDAELVSLMRFEGHDVLYVAEFRPGATDSDVFLKWKRLNDLLKKHGAKIPGSFGSARDVDENPILKTKVANLCQNQI